MTDKTFKAEIDNMSYYDLLKRWRHSPSSDPIFQGESGKYYSKVMAEKEAELKPGEKAKISKSIGW
jgi:hypothetical protein